MGNEGSCVALGLKAWKTDRFAPSIPSAREPHKSLRLPCLHLLSTTPSHLYFGKVFQNMGATLFDCSSVALILNHIPMLDE